MREKDPTEWESKWKDWPTKEQLQNLSGQANGLFHYAATALQWIKGQIDRYGTAAKQDFDKFAQKGMDPLNHLYGVILTSFEDPDPDRRTKQLHGFQHVFGTILVLQEPLTIRQITALLADISENDFDVVKFLQHFRSVLIPGTTAAFKEATPQMHKSFRDYIMNAAPPKFRIHTGEAQFVTARSCLEIIVKAASQSTEVVGYCVQHGHEHLRKAVETGTTWEDERMWQLFGQMAGDAVVNVWKGNSWQVFIAVAAAGWKLLKQGTDEHKMEGISNIVMKAKVRDRSTLKGMSKLIGGNAAGS
ncbi:hypothetical protein B0H13DRAFT_1662042 [Mycena leptocephala]|nr:hypothetical protein B0H13DRAFT_1662042 [Mycena leptocephala]